MSAYVAQLKASVAAEEAENAAADRQAKIVALEVAKERMTPLDERLKRVLKTIPDAILAEGIPLQSIKVMLRGRWRGNAHPGDLADALRRAGFERVRGWQSGMSFRAIWRRN